MASSAVVKDEYFSLKHRFQISGHNKRFNAVEGKQAENLTEFRYGQVDSKKDYMILLTNKDGMISVSGTDTVDPLQ